MHCMLRFLGLLAVSDCGTSWALQGLLDCSRISTRNCGSWETASTGQTQECGRCRPSWSQDVRMKARDGAAQQRKEGEQPAGNSNPLGWQAGLSHLHFCAWDQHTHTPVDMPPSTNVCGTESQHLVIDVATRKRLSQKLDQQTRQTLATGIGLNALVDTPHCSQRQPVSAASWLHNQATERKGCNTVAQEHCSVFLRGSASIRCWRHEWRRHMQHNSKCAERASKGHWFMQQETYMVSYPQVHHMLL